jgi:hypothetical protein
VRGYILRFISENDHASILHFVGNCFVDFFVFLYKTWFTLLLKSSTLFIDETYIIKTAVAVFAFIITVYTIFFVLKKIINLLLRLTGVSIIRILKSIFYKPFQKKNLRQISRDNEPQERVK